ncbi:putative sulfate exporter family transporter [Flavisolibacter sp. BT320]|nr:putative sulfate exporter family transporter [Flavisolibacter longurius]
MEASTQTNKGQFSEDSWAVAIGSTLIALTLLLALLNPAYKFTTPNYKWQNSTELFSKVFSPGNLVIIVGTGLLLALVASVAILFSRGSVKRFLPGFAILYSLAVLSFVMAGNQSLNAYGIEYVIFALVAGLLLNNLFSLPRWLKDAARSEFFIKTGLVILGSSVLFTDILKAGFPGLIQAILVVAAVWFFAMWLSRRLKVDDEFAVILASAVSICGVSAAIVAAGAIGGDKKKLSYVTTLVLLVAIPMLLLQPWAVKYFGIPEIVGGAWLGGTLDTTASVTAASEILGPLAVKVGVIIKFSQNVLIGLAAFFIAWWWLWKKKEGNLQTGEKPSLQLVWSRFPKFVIGFILVSLLFSFIVPAATTKQVSGMLNSLRSAWFALAFVAIGIEARFADLVSVQGGRPAISFITAQLFNIIWTLIVAYVLFSGRFFSLPDIR